MVMAWIDEDQDNEAWLIDEPDNDSQIDDFIGTLTPHYAGSRCSAFLSWTPVNEAQDYSLLGSLDGPWKVSRGFAGWEVKSWSAAARLSGLILDLRKTIQLLNDDIHPVGDLDSTVAQLEVLVDKCSRPSQKGPTGRTEHKAPRPRYPLIDWRAVNRRQAEGLPEGLLTEEGSPLAAGPAIKTFSVYLPEVDEDE